MARKKGDMVERTRNVRFYVSDEEHSLLRQAAAESDKSICRFAVDAAVEAARRVVGNKKRKDKE